MYLDRRHSYRVAILLTSFIICLSWAIRKMDKLTEDIRVDT